LSGVLCREVPPLHDVRGWDAELPLLVVSTSVEEVATGRLAQRTEGRHGVRHATRPPGHRRLAALPGQPRAHARRRQLVLDFEFRFHLFRSRRVPDRLEVATVAVVETESL